MLKPVARWETWDEPDRDVAVAKWVERGIRVVFPLHWAAHHGQREMIARAKERIAEIEGKSGRNLVPGSVLLAFSRHVEILPRENKINPDVSASLLTMGDDG
jgi:hypothetical protein